MKYLEGTHSPSPWSGRLGGGGGGGLAGWLVGWLAGWSGWLVGWLAGLGSLVSIFEDEEKLISNILDNHKLYHTKP